ncbi:hypothetical protein B7P43_G04211 [Cryptotermes secundus]|uniref:Uncharacterized protein n=1 Tax=Cryptotermes secundus TaxID=105785 RepID=A0A2J7PKP8_9NEOP|nr:uncharacterized protein LOC111873305 [Cryptotermes secundus]PNF16917.1 hypothetical protein B7P43_G04211 [Cryptotermes secundus]
MSRPWRTAIDDAAKETEEDRETKQFAREAERPEHGQGTQELLELSQGEQPPPSIVKELLRKVLDQEEEDKPEMQPLPPKQQVSSSQTNVQYRILTRQKGSTHTHHSNVGSGKGLLQNEWLRHGNHLPEQAGNHNQSSGEKMKHETNQEPYLSKTERNYPRYQTGPQELLQHQTVNTQMQTYYGKTFPQKVTNNPMPQMAHDQQYNAATEVGMNSAPQGLPELNLPLHLQGFLNPPVLCPLGMLPSGACPWKGDNRYREMHVDTSHANYTVSTNFIRLSRNCVMLMNVYAEYFLCYAVAVTDPDRLYCVVQHACTSYNCMLTYQYRCDIYAENRYEKLSVTKLVAHFRDDFNTLTQKGNCLSLDRATVNSFTADNGFYVNVTILIPEQV